MQDLLLQSRLVVCMNLNSFEVTCVLVSLESDGRVELRVVTQLSHWHLALPTSLWCLRNDRSNIGNTLSWGWQYPHPEPELAKYRKKDLLDTKWILLLLENEPVTRLQLLLSFRSPCVFKLWNNLNLLWKDWITGWSHLTSFDNIQQISELTKHERPGSITLCICPEVMRCRLSLVTLGAWPRRCVRSVEADMGHVTCHYPASDTCLIRMVSLNPASPFIKDRNSVRNNPSFMTDPRCRSKQIVCGGCGCFSGLIFLFPFFYFILLTNTSDIFIAHHLCQIVLKCKKYKAFVLILHIKLNL